MQLSDGRTVAAQIVAARADADLAFLLIEEEGPLRPLPLGDSDAVLVGDLVFAIGNPFGLRETVTNGIVSATGRRLMRDGLFDLLQTNAEINPGNSGGPLVNIRGEVIGINTAIAAMGQPGWQGVGFAVSSNTVRQALDSLMEHGRIVRGHLGVVIQEVTAEIAEELGVDRAGVLVREVTPGSPAARAGVSPGDIIVSINGEPIADFRDLRRRINRTPIGTTVDVGIIHQGQHRSLAVVIEEMPEEAQTARP